MTRRLAERHPRRLSRMRPQCSRPEHGADLALVSLGDQPASEPDANAHADQRLLRTLAEENALLARELGRVQARCTRWRDDCIAQAERLEAVLMRARAEIIIKETQLAAVRDTLDGLHQRAAAWLTNEELVRRIGDLRARNQVLQVELADRRVSLKGPAAAEGPNRHGRQSAEALRVLCVGGRARQVPVYQALVEQEGGRFLHVDGSTSDSLPALRRLLADADVVILQPAFVCQGACQAVQAHCARQGLRCVQVDKTCALAFARGLAQALHRA
jgi:hypothetical protein